MDMKRTVKSAMHQLRIDKLRKLQTKPINSILAGQDTFVLAPTSSGKSAIYDIPALLCTDKPTIVLEPTIALMHDQVRHLNACNVSAAYIDSSLSGAKQDSIASQFCKGKIHILFVTPERFVSKRFSNTLRKVPLYMVVVDEAHCVLDWGYSFRSSYLAVGETIRSLKHRPIVSAFTATASPDDIKQICRLLHMQQPAVYQSSLYRKNLTFLKKHADDRKQKRHLLRKYLRKYHHHASIIYCNTRKAVDAVYDFLKTQYPDDVVKCHAEMSPQKRAAHELQFLRSEKTIMVATSAFGMGVDLDTVDLIIHFNMPLSITDYIQQSGRGGRSGQKARCILLYDEEDYYTNQVILSSSFSGSSQERALHRLDAMKEYCDDRSQCLVALLLQMFEQVPAHRCNHCTNCQRARRK